MAKGFDGGLKPGQRRYGSSRTVKLGRVAGDKKGVWKMFKLPVELLHQWARAGLVGEWRDPEGVLEGFESREAPLSIEAVPDGKGVLE